MIPFRCRNKDHGCSSSYRRSDLLDHESSSCAYRPVPCFSEDCGVRIPVSKLLQHANDKHWAETELWGTSSAITVRYEVRILSLKLVLIKWQQNVFHDLRFRPKYPRLQASSGPATLS